MHLLFLDEFGHEHPWDDRQCPVFGYGGLLIPAENYAEFTRRFFDHKIAWLRTLYIARATQRLRGDNPKLNASFLPSKSPEYIAAMLEKMKTLHIAQLAQDPEVRRLASQHEVKGVDVFSATYYERLAERGLTSKEKYDRRYNYMQRLLQFRALLQDSEAQVFYYGIHKSAAARFTPSQRIHVEFVRDVLLTAHRFARQKRSTVKVVFDHHHTDDYRRIKDENGVVQMHKGKPRTWKTRAQRAEEVMLANALFDCMPEPIFNAKSHLSQGVQAADWICALLRIMLVQRTTRNAQSNTFHEVVEDFLEDLTASTSEFKFKPHPDDEPRGRRQQDLFSKPGPRANP